MNQEMDIMGKLKEMQDAMGTNTEIKLFKGDHWASIKFSNDIMMDALAKHLLGLMQYGMTDLGEVLEVIGNVKPGDEDGWNKSWSKLAKGLEKRAEIAEKNGKLVSASSEYLRASTYWRASLMYFSCPKDSRMKENAQASMNCYEKYLKLSGYPGTYVEIPYEDSYLPGHFYRSPVADEKAPLLIITPGRDTWAQDTRWVYDGALKRGIHCLIYDGPGQGFALRLQNMPFRHDWENVITPIIDFALEIPGIDKERIALMGMSFGGFLVPRAVAFDKRVKLCIVDPGNLSWGDNIADRLQMISSLPADKRPASMDWMLRDYAWKHGVSVEDIVNELKIYDNTDIVDKITCKMLVLDGTAEMTPGEAEKFYNALKCPKHYMLFDESTTAQAHTQMGGYAAATEYIFDWIEEEL